MNDNFLTVEMMKHLAIYQPIEDAKYALIQCQNGLCIPIDKSMLISIDPLSFQLVFPYIYSLDDLMKMCPYYLYGKGIDYELQMSKYGDDGFNVAYQNPYNKHDILLESYGHSPLEVFYSLYIKVMTFQQSK